MYDDIGEITLIFKIGVIKIYIVGKILVVGCGNRI